MRMGNRQDGNLSNFRIEIGAELRPNLKLRLKPRGQEETARLDSLNAQSALQLSLLVVA